MSFKFGYIYQENLAYFEVTDNSQISVARIMVYVLFILSVHFELSVQATYCHHHPHHGNQAGTAIICYSELLQ